MKKLTERENQLARELAYFKALERGNGELPEYDADSSVNDFAKAAEQIVSRRIQLLENGVHLFPIEKLFDFKNNELVVAKGFFKMVS